MTIDTSNDYYFNMREFSNLFSDTINPEAIESLKISASQGEARSIELLSNLALRRDEHGKLAEKILFDLFCGIIPTDHQLCVAQNIQGSAQMLYQLSARDNMKNNTDMHKLRTPSKLLYMAGASADTAGKLALSRIFSQAHNSPFNDVDIWNSARMITTDEIKAATTCYARRHQAHEINFPIGLIHAQTNENILSQQISEQCKYPTFLAQPEIFPVNTGEHWVTFAVYKSDDAQPRAVICNTGNELSSQTKQHLIDAANLAGVTDSDHIVFLESNIQSHIPNGCGLLTIEAIRLLMENNFQSPVEVLQDFLSSFTQMSVEEQERYNLQNRSHIYAETYLQ